MSSEEREKMGEEESCTKCPHNTSWKRKIVKIVGKEIGPDRGGGNTPETKNFPAIQKDQKTSPLRSGDSSNLHSSLSRERGSQSRGMGARVGSIDICKIVFRAKTEELSTLEGRSGLAEVRQVVASSYHHRSGS